MYVRLFARNLIQKLRCIFADKLKRTVLIGMIIIGLTCAILNIILGGFPWTMLALGFLRYVWKLMFNQNLFENYFSGRLMSFLTGCTILIANLMIIYATNIPLVLIWLLIFWSIQMVSLIANLIQYGKSGQFSPLHFITSGAAFLVCFIVSYMLSSQSMMAFSGIALICWVRILFNEISIIKNEGKKRLHMV